MPSTTVSRGNILVGFLIGPSLTPVSVLANTSAEQTFTVPGLLVGDVVGVTFNGVMTAGLGITNARVSAVNVLTVGFQNSTAGPLTPTAGTYTLSVERPENLPLPTNAV